ncbi:MAG TPA: LamG-like jellyroll fold domain-containing protein [Woeseiaceae bacterium]|nr:LamG-like jellyroll fold domain-containing protein [Woeseiaceae bacterium]
MTPALRTPAGLLRGLLPAPALVLATACAAGDVPAGDGVVTWQLDNLESIGGHAVTLAGDPRVIDTPGGKAVEFDGEDDAIFLDVHPLAGMTAFTVEVVFRPDRDGAAEQRFFHMQADGAESRVMFETRLVDNERWFLDTFIKSGEQNVVLYAKDHEHPLDRWQHAAIVVDGDTMRHYVNGGLELEAPLDYAPQQAGRTSLGVRLNRVHWFKGAIRSVRITPRALDAGELQHVASPQSGGLGGPEEPLAYLDDDVPSASGYEDGYHHGRLRPAVGVQNYEVMRANRSHPEWSDGLGFTYNHAPNLAYWNGRFYYHYLATPVGEHIPPGVTLLTTSANGKDWGKPEVLFPMGFWSERTEVREDQVKNLVMHQRMGFYVAPGGRLLASGFYGINDGHGMGRVMREIHADGSFGPIFFVRKNTTWKHGDFMFPDYTSSDDDGFVAAVDAFLADPVRRIQWWEEHWLEPDIAEFVGGLQPVGGAGAQEPGKAFNFFTRDDGVIVGLFKDSYATITEDGGRHWSPLVKLPRFTWGGAKAWAQKLDTGDYALVVNPTHSMARHPLAVATSEDGIRFHGMAAVHQELPVKRYWGLHKRPGQQYVRGIVEGNGNPPGDDLWVAYSVSKEDMWVSRIPVPVRRTVEGPVADDFDCMEPGGVVTDWNIYHGPWHTVEIVAGPDAGRHSLKLADRDPYDYASAQRVFAGADRQTLGFELYFDEQNGPLEMDVVTGQGDRLVPMRLERGSFSVRNPGGSAAGGKELSHGRWHGIEVRLDAPSRTFELLIDGSSILANAPFAGEADGVPERIDFRTGDYRAEDDVQKQKSGSEDVPGWDEPGADEPVPASTYYIRDFRATSSR